MCVWKGSEFRFGTDRGANPVVSITFDPILNGVTFPPPDGTNALPFIGTPDKLHLLPSGCSFSLCSQEENGGLQGSSRTVPLTFDPPLIHRTRIHAKENFQRCRNHQRNLEQGGSQQTLHPGWAPHAFRISPGEETAT